MKICVLGAGVIGVTTAYMLARDGHEVILLEQASKPAMGASKANGAQLSYSYVDPFPSPETLRSLPKYFLGKDNGIQVGFSLRPTYLKWGLDFVKNCNAKAYDRNFSARLNLAKQSRELVTSFEDEIGERLLKPTGKGKLLIVETKTAMDALKTSAEAKLGAGFEPEVLTRRECFNLCPELAGRTGQIVGGIYSADDEALDTQLYCEALLNNRHNAKPDTIFGERIKSLRIENNRVVAVVGQINEYSCDAVVACLGDQTNEALGSYIRPLPIYPVQGYSLTLPVTEATPVMSITDMAHKFVFANLGDHVRIAGFTDLNQNAARSQKRAEALLATARNIWPHIADYEADPNFWIGQRPMTPSGIPVIKESRVEGLFINAGHGSLGYTFATGSAAIISNLIGPAG